MIDFTDVPDQFHRKAIPASTLLEILQGLGDLNGAIIEPSPTTGNLLVFRRTDGTTMHCLGVIEVSEECFRPETGILNSPIPVRWQRDW